LNKLDLQESFVGITYRYAAPEWIAPKKGFIPTEKCDVYRLM